VLASMVLNKSIGIPLAIKWSQFRLLAVPLHVVIPGKLFT